MPTTVVLFSSQWVGSESVFWHLLAIDNIIFKNAIKFMKDTGELFSSELLSLVVNKFGKILATILGHKRLL